MSNYHDTREKIELSLEKSKGIESIEFDPHNTSPCLRCNGASGHRNPLHSVRRVVAKKETWLRCVNCGGEFGHRKNKARVEVFKDIPDAAKNSYDLASAKSKRRRVSPLVQLLIQTAIVSSGLGLADLVLENLPKPDGQDA